MASNVESSHCYPDCNAFFAEVFRVLKPGGCFLYTDFTAPGKAPAEYIRDITAALDCAGFVNVESSDITQQILRGLDADNDRRIREIHEGLAFDEIARAWQRLGYPFQALTPSFASALGASGSSRVSSTRTRGTVTPR